MCLLLTHRHEIFIIILIKNLKDNHPLSMLPDFIKQLSLDRLLPSVIQLQQTVIVLRMIVIGCMKNS